MKRRLGLVGVGCWLALVLPLPAWGATDYDGDGFIAGDCAPLDAAAHPGAADYPDVAIEDLDCDGIDGTAAGAYFVATTGNDGTGTGAAAKPFRTIAFAIAKAAAAVPKRDVYVQAGTYTEHVVLAGGVSLYGGYGPGGTRALASVTRIQAPAGQPEAVLADGAQGVELQLLEVRGANAAAGESSYAIRAVGGATLALTSVKATGGSAGAGGAGGTGTTGTAGNGGRCGGYSTGTCNLNSIGGSGGSGAVGGGVAGGKGADGVSGAAGKTGGAGADNGALTGGAGGLAGHQTLSCSDNPDDLLGFCGGHDGMPGAPGGAGARGTGAAFGVGGATATWANAAAATSGGTGVPGSGGGGGGSGLSSSAGCVSGSGGGGGGSGTGGTGGAGGSNGGGSFGVYLKDSALVVDGGVLTGGTGGAGGAGGDGGTGGPGGAGGERQPGTGAGCYKGGRGGKGGDGGQGGGGGGGAGGPSVGVFATAAANYFVRANATVSGGTAGGGGAAGAGGTGTAGGGAGASAGTLAQPGANATPQDFDGDGKTDAADPCPAVPAPGTTGCLARPAKLADGDRDSIPDARDACPAQAGGPTDTDANGCPGNQADADGDGYPAAQDCDDTQPLIHPGLIETPGNNLDENCDGIIAPFPRVTATVSTSGGVTTTTTIFLRLLIRQVPGGGKVQLRCAGGKARCPFKAKKLKVSRKHTADGLKALSKRQRGNGLVFKPGATLEVRITAPAYIGKVVRYKIVRGRFPVGKTLCLAPGTKKPKACPPVG